MQGQIRKLSVLLLLIVSALLMSCASERSVAVVNDPDDHTDKSMIPWNKQEKWEAQGNLGNITDRR